MLKSPSAKPDRRHIYRGTIEFRLTSLPPDETYFGAGINISKSGMCIHTFDLLKEGDTIELLTPLPVPHRKATVRWVKECCERFYKTGIMFIK